MSEQVFNGEATAVFQYMPPGRSVICASVNGKPGRREVVVDAKAAERLQRDLEEKLAAAAAGVKARPCGLFDHKDGAASLIPQRFRWDERRGVLLEAVWTDAGRAAVEGRNYSYWSPSFRLSKGGEVVGLQDGVEVGSLVNNPAFETIEPVAASRAEVDEPEEDDVDVNGGGVEVDAEHCNQYQHVPGCPHENEGGGNKSWQRQSKVRKAIQSGDDDAAEKAVVEVIEDAKKDGDETGARFWKEMLDSMRREREEKKRMKEVLERAHRRNSGNVKSSNQKNTMKENKTNNEGGEEVFASKRVCDALSDALDAVAAAHECVDAACGDCDDEEDDPDERKAWQKKLDELKAALDKEEDEAKRAVLKKRIAEVESANPYGCNQYGHSFRSYHRGFSSNRNLAKKEQAKKNAVDKMNELARKRRRKIK